MERIVAGLQQRRVVSEKEKRILAYHEAGHAVMSHLVGDLFPAQKATIVSRGQALGYTLNTPAEDRYLHTREEFVDLMKVFLAGRAAEQVVFGRITNGAANDLERVTEIARSMVFEFGMSEVAPSRTMRADNYALSEETKRLRDSEQARLTDHAYEEAQRLLLKHRAALDRVAAALLEKETLDRAELRRAARGRDPESRSSETVGTIRALPMRDWTLAGSSRAECRGFTTSASPSPISTRPSRRTSDSSAHGSSIASRSSEQGVEAASMLVGESRFELVAPTGEDTPVGRFLARRGPGMHHVAYETDDVCARRSPSSSRRAPS